MGPLQPLSREALNLIEPSKSVELPRGLSEAWRMELAYSELLAQFDEHQIQDPGTGRLKSNEGDLPINFDVQDLVAMENNFNRLGGIEYNTKAAVTQGIRRSWQYLEELISRSGEV